MSSILDIIGEYDDFLDQQQGYRIVILFLKDELYYNWPDIMRTLYVLVIEN